jgi:hypothetical protein
VSSGSPRPADAQSIGADPYDPWNAMYRPFIFPTAPLNPGMPNQGQFDPATGRPTSNQFGRYLESVGIGLPSDPFGRSGRGGGGRFTPYYQNLRQGGGAYDRTYVANPDDTFYVDQQEREEEYVQASRIKDPKKRSEALRKLRQEAQKAARSGTAARGYKPPAEMPPTSRRTPTTGTGAAAARGEPGRGLIPPERLREATSLRRGFSTSETLQRSRAMSRARRNAAATRSSEAGGPATTTITQPAPELPADDVGEVPPSR